MKELISLAVLLVTVFVLLLFEGFYVNSAVQNAEELMNIKTKYTLEEVYIKTNGNLPKWEP